MRARRHRFHIAPLDRYDYADTMQTTGVVVGVLAAWKEVKAVIDLIGVGRDGDCLSHSTLVAGLLARVRSATSIYLSVA